MAGEDQRRLPEKEQLQDSLPDRGGAAAHAGAPGERWTGERTSAFPARSPTCAGCTRRGIGARLWTMRMFAGFGQPHETNQRLKFLPNNGQTGLSVAFDMPTLYGSTPTTRERRASSANAEWRCLPWQIWKGRSMACPLGRSPPP